ncbi:MAG: hypothetical protein M1830_001865 [Pleopsidium flavum]|nr:MAG: hypothetical protein M1830_001865 [Pleopsidium flavum]
MALDTTLTVERQITSRFDGVIKKLYYEAEDMAQVGKPLCDIDIQSEISPEDEAVITPPTEQATAPAGPQQPSKAAEQHEVKEMDATLGSSGAAIVAPKPSSKHATLATPAVRGLLKELDVTISEVTGTGKEGRVLKDDVYKFAAQRDTTIQSSTPAPALLPTSDAPQQETTTPLTPIQTLMFKAMTRSLSIPHFLYADETNLTPLTTLRKSLATHPTHPIKISALPFIIKAVSLALNSFPLLNARLSSESTTPKLIFRPNHNIGIAVATPQGLLVPVLKSVQNKSILALSAEITHLSTLARAGKLSAADVTGGTFTISNIGSIGGTYVSPLIVEGELAILGVGKSRVIPAFDENDKVVRREVGCFSWSADHRIVDGAMVAKCAEIVKGFLEEPALMVVRGR